MPYYMAAAARPLNVQGLLLRLVYLAMDGQAAGASYLVKWTNNNNQQQQHVHRHEDDLA
jgi:hypothetical protein